MRGRGMVSCRAGWRARLSLLAMALVVPLLTACLAPGEWDPTGHSPFGNLELNAQSGSGIRVSGWAIDPDTPMPVDVHVKVEGYDLRVVRADRSRPDVAAAYPGRGASHGFDLSVGDLGPGKRQVCVWVPDVGAGGRVRVLGCRDVFISVDPFGNLESLSATMEPGRTDGTVRASGWIADPETTGPTMVGVAMDGRNVVVQPTDVARPDVAAAFGTGPVRGYDITFPAPPGRHTVCVVAGNVGWGESRFVGCSDVVVQAPPDRRPDLRLTSVTPLGDGSVRILGSVSDPDSPGGPVVVRVRTDGGPHQSTTATGGVLDTAVGGLGSGRHELCVSALDVPGTAPGVAGERVLPCSTVVLGGGAPSIATTGAVTSSRPVGPPAGFPLQYVDRDAGVSVSLRDGSTLWLFGDSSEVDPSGKMLYFVNNTAAWAAPGSPAVTRDAASAGRPYQFVDPGSSWACPPDKPHAAMWPMSAVATPSGSSDLVTAFFAKVCLGPGFLQIEAHGVAVVRWTYDPANPPVDAPIVGAVAARDVFPASQDYGEAAVAVADGTAGTGDQGWYVYAYQCESPTGDGPIPATALGPCRVGRVPVASVTDRSAWRFWNGAAWVTSSASAAAVLQEGRTDPEIPVASFQVAHDPVLGLYTMAYSPWPGFIDRAYVRVATSPVGPWTRPVAVQLPGCGEFVGRSFYACYAAGVQPRFSTNSAGVTSIGIGWYDRLVSVGPIRGSYRVASVPFSVRLP